VPFPSSVLFFFFKQKTAYEIGLGIPAEPLFRSMQCDRLMLMVGLSFLTLSRWLTTDSRRFMIIPMLCVTIFVILVVWFLLPRVARLMIHTPTAISMFVCLSMVQLMVVFISMRCTLCALLPFLISCLIWLDLVASLPLIKERILVIILLLHFLSLMLGSVLVLMLPLLVWLTPDLRIKKSLL